MPRRVSILANPIAGGGKGAALAPELARALEAQGCTASVQLTTHGGHARELAADLDKSRTDVLVAVGGDGTVNEVVCGMRDFEVEFAQLPLGTANVLACELDLPRDPAGCAAMIAAGHSIRSTLGEIAAPRRRFVLFAGLGLDAHIVHRLAATRTGTLGKHKWAGPIAHTIRHWPSDRLAVETAEGRRWDGLSQVLVTRVRNYGGWFEMPGAIDIEDGQLHVLGFRQRSRWAYIRANWRAFRKKLRVGRDVEHAVTRELRVWPADRAVPVQVDGDPAGTCAPDLPLRIHCTDQPLRLLTPRRERQAGAGA